MINNFFRPAAVLFLFITFAAGKAESWTLPKKCDQVILGLTEDWESSCAELQLWEREGKKWRPASKPWPARIGKEGLAWGRGVHPPPPPAGVPMKEEGDWRSPAGVFELGDAYGHADSPPAGAAWAYHPFTEKDLWIEDPASEYYNMRMSLDHLPETEWEKKQQMRRRDPAHRLKIFIRHNAIPNILPGAGSSIFFHIWRLNGDKPTAGCTAMSAKKLREMLRWLKPESRPLFILLPEDFYSCVRAEWDLP